MISKNIKDLQEMTIKILSSSNLSVSVADTIFVGNCSTAGEYHKRRSENMSSILQREFWAWSCESESCARSVSVQSVKVRASDSFL